MMWRRLGAALHEWTQVSFDAIIGKNTTVWQFASVVRGSVIGERCNVGSCAIVDAAAVGDDCSIGHGAQLHPGTKLGNRVFVGPGAIICNDMWPRVDKEGFHVERLLSGDAWTVIVEDDASIGAGAIILPGVRIHAGAMVAAGAVVDRAVPSGMVWRRNGYIGAIPDDVNERRMRFVS